MRSFVEFITEAKKDRGPELVHDLMFHGHRGMEQAGHILDAVHRKLLGKTSAVKITTEYSGKDKKKDPVLVPNPSHYTIGEQRRFLNHLENAKRVYSGMKPEALDLVKRHSYSLKHHLTGMSPKTEPPKTDGFIDYLVKQHDSRTDRDDQSVEAAKKRKSYTDTLEHVAAHRKHYDKALELHHHLTRAQDVLAGVISKHYKMNGQKVGPDGVVATGHMGTARIKRKA
jgi:hypothetical protein